MKNNLRYRQIHLDFHTCEHLPTVGKNFDGETFAKTLKEAGVDSITCFARCHHGWIYYDSKKLSHLVHPNISNRNLLKEQIEWCHKYEINVPVYTTVQWDDKVAREHREWLVMDEHGGPFKQKTFAPGFYRNLCLNTGYVDYLKETIVDLFENLGTIDGLFLDILNIQPCCCPACVKEMKEKKIDVSDVNARYTFAQMVSDRFKEDMSKFIRNIQLDCPIYYNSGFISTRHRKYIDTFTHLEIESLPGSGQWGYDHFPVTSRYARTLGVDFLGMTGKFHTDWGDFSSFKNKEALEYECFKSIAYCGKCSIGDQLHPLGEISLPVYKLIGGVYNSIKEKEPYLINAEPVVEVGLMTPEEFMNEGTLLVTKDLVGATKLLTEIGTQFNIIDSFEDFSKYKLLVLPDFIPFTDELENKIKNYINSGGKIIASYQSGFNKAKNEFSDLFGIKYVSEAPYSPDFIVANGEIGEGLYKDTEYVMYLKAIQVALTTGTELLKVNTPYFNRTWEHFTSHRHTPSSKMYGYPGVVKNDNVIYFSHPVFRSYQTHGNQWIKTLVKNSIKSLLGQQMVSHDGPSTLELTFNEQVKNKRFVMHALHYIPVRKCDELDIIEDVISLYNTTISIFIPKKNIKRVYKANDESNIIFSYENDILTLIVDEIKGHQMVVIEY